MKASSPPRHPGHPHPKYIVDAAGKRVSVVISMDEYEALMEDMADLGALAERRTEETVEHAQVIERLKADGLL